MPASAQVRRVAPLIEQLGSAVFIEAVVSSTTSTSSGCGMPPEMPAVAVAVMVTEDTPTRPANHVCTVACCRTTMPLALAGATHATPVEVKHFSVG